MVRCAEAQVGSGGGWGVCGLGQLGFTHECPESKRVGIWRHGQSPKTRPRKHGQFLRLKKEKSHQHNDILV